MRIVHLYEDDDNLRDNIAEMLMLENYSCKAYQNFDEFIKETSTLIPDVAICSLSACTGTTCQLEPLITSMSNSKVIFLSKDRDYCSCCRNHIALNIPFTYEELMESLLLDIS